MVSVGRRWLLWVGDAYAFGVMLYELYSGKPAWAGLSTGDIISAKLRSHVSASLHLPGEGSPALQVITSCVIAIDLLYPCITAATVHNILHLCNMVAGGTAPSSGCISASKAVLSGMAVASNGLQPFLKAVKSCWPKCTPSLEWSTSHHVSHVGHVCCQSGLEEIAQASTQPTPQVRCCLVVAAMHCMPHANLELSVDGSDACMHLLILSNRAPPEVDLCHIRFAVVMTPVFVSCTSWQAASSIYISA